MAKRRIALVGTASSGQHAPYSDPSWEVWGVSARASYVTRANRWFELHRLDGEPQDWADKWRQTMRGFTHNIDELVMLYPEKDLGPNVIAYPHERILARFGSFNMTSSFAWMMALAIDEMVPPGLTLPAPGECEIGIWGVDMEYGTEYRQQRTGFRHFIDLARVLNVTVTRLATGGLSYEPVPYPMWQDDPLMSKVATRSSDTQKNLKTLENSLRVTHDMIAQNKGGMTEIAMMQQQGDAYDASKRFADLDRQTTALKDTSARISHDIVKHEATWEEQRWLLDYLQP